MHLATKTLEAIEQAVESDGGNSFRAEFEKAIADQTDAFRQEPAHPRPHLGGSQIGEFCERKLWFIFRWAARRSFGGRTLRLFHRGHVEEARFVALLRAAGVNVIQHDPETGGQLRMGGYKGHFSGSLDGCAIGVPDLEGLCDDWQNEPCLTEFKTANEKNFKALLKAGVKEWKPTYYAQMMVYMRARGFRFALFMAVNKNDDTLYAEIVEANDIEAGFYNERARRVVDAKVCPDRPDWAGEEAFGCRFCDAKAVCYGNEQPQSTCRLCAHAQIEDRGVWRCGNTGALLMPPQQMAACAERKPVLINEQPAEWTW